MHFTFQNLQLEIFWIPNDLKAVILYLLIERAKHVNKCIGELLLLLFFLT